MIEPHRSGTDNTLQYVGTLVHAVLGPSSPRPSAKGPQDRRLKSPPVHGMLGVPRCRWVIICPLKVEEESRSRSRSDLLSEINGEKGSIEGWSQRVMCNLLGLEEEEEEEEDISN